MLAVRFRAEAEYSGAKGRKHVRIELPAQGAAGIKETAAAMPFSCPAKNNNLLTPGSFFRLSTYPSDNHEDGIIGGLGVHAPGSDVGQDGVERLLSGA